MESELDCRFPCCRFWQAYKAVFRLVDMLPCRMSHWLKKIDRWVPTPTQRGANCWAALQKFVCFFLYIHRYVQNVTEHTFVGFGLLLEAAQCALAFHTSALSMFGAFIE